MSLGIVPVESDGSVYCQAPIGKQLLFQALDENHMAIQTERTYVNYMPGETRSCIGCHETPNDTPADTAQWKPIALTREASVPGPQPGEESGQRPLDFSLDVQPVLDAIVESAARVCQIGIRAGKHLGCGERRRPGRPRYAGSG